MSFRKLRLRKSKSKSQDRSESRMRSTRDDILPSQIVSNFFKASDDYQKYRVQFKDVYKHFLSCVGMEDRDWNLKTPPADLRCNALYQQLVQIYGMTNDEGFLSTIRPAFESAVAAEIEYYGQMKTAMQGIHDFYANEFEAKKTEFAGLAPELETLQKNRSSEPEQIQQMDKVIYRFTELQRMLKEMIQPGVHSIQSQHLQAMRDCMDLFQKQNEQWSQCFSPFAKYKPKVSLKTRPKDEENGKHKADKLAEDDRDI